MKNNHTHDMNTQRNTHNRHIRLLRGAVLAAAMLFSYAGAQAQTPPPHVTVGGSVFGGGNLAPVGRGTKVLIDQANAEVNGDVYGGGAKAEVDTLRKASPMPTSVAADSVTITILQGSVGGDVYGGGLGNADTAANVYGPVFVNIGTGTVGGDGFATSTSGSATISGSVYGCNNLNGTPKDNVFVNIYQTAHTTANTYPDPEPSLADLATPAASTAYALTAVYGGGNQAAYSPVDDTKVAQVHVYTCLNTIETVYGGGNAADATKVALTIDGGRFDRVFGGGNGYSAAIPPNHTNSSGADYNPGANISGSATTQIHGGLYRQVFGGSNQYGDVANASLIIDKTSNCDELIAEAFGGANEADITGNVTTNLLCGGNIRIGTFYGGSNAADIDGDVTLNVYGGTYSNVFGGSKGRSGNTPADSANITGDVTLNLFGGHMTNAFGGSDVNGNIAGSITVNMLDLEAVNCSLVVNNIYGGGRDAAYTPSTPGAYPEVNLIHGSVTKNGDKGGNVYGGGFGATAIVTSTPTVNVGYDASMAALATSLKGSALTTSTVAVAGNVFGGGEAAPVSGNTTVTLQQVTSGVTASTTVSGDVYGGGNLADVSGNTDVAVNGGTVSTDVYGGGALADVGTNGSNHTNVTIAGGTVSRSVYGGGLGQFDDPATTSENEAVEALVKGAVQVTIDGGTVKDVFGCNNINGRPTDSVRVDINSNVGGNVFGGGNLATYTGNPYVYINNGTVSGNVFGGGNGDPADNTQTKGSVTGIPHVIVGDTLTAHSAYQAIVSGDVYGGGNAAKVVTGTPVVTVLPKCNTEITSVYGGGNAADVPATSVTIHGGTIDSVYGGGHGDKDVNPAIAANVTGNTSVTITGGTIGQVFGGSNENGTISGAIGVNVNKGNNSCPMVISAVYGGGNFAASNAGTINIGCTGASSSEYIDTVFGGANRANVTGDITLNITGGRINNAFGGNNNSGAIDGDISVNVEWATPACGDNHLGNVYGAGNLASYSQKTAGHPEVNIKNGTAANVFGGGKGASAVVTGNPVVTIGDANGSHVANVTGRVYGGGDAAAVTGNTTVTYNDNNASSVVDSIFGGGNAAGVSGTATVTLTSGKVSGGLYGGCNTEGTVSGDITVTLTGGTVGVDGTTTDVVYGGGFGHNTATGGDVTVTLGSTTVYGNLYGGSALGSVNGSSSNSTTVTIGGNGLNGKVFGGGMGSGSGASTQATTLGDVVINYNTANSGLTGIYGGANVNGRVVGNISVNVNADVGTSGDGNGRDIFGGGLGAHTSTDGNVTVTLGDNTNTAQPVVYGDIYGGSALGQVNDAEADLTTVNILSGTLHGNAFGGGLGKADAADSGQVNGTIIVNVGETDGALSPSYTGFATIDGSVYGCNNTNGSPQGNVTVNIYKTGHTEGVNTTADAGFAITNVFGGGKKANFNASGKKAYVNVFTCDNTIGDLYGGGDAADVPGSAVTIWGGRFDKVFGGGNGAGVGNPGANIGTGGITIAIHGGNIGTLVNASNEKGSIGGTINVTVDNEGGCNEEVDEFFGGSNMVDITGNVNTTIACGAGTFGAVYGGSNKANIDGNVSLTIQGGTIGRVFGGSKGDLSSLGGDHSDVSANITRNVTLTLNGGSIGAAFGGSNINGTIRGTITVNVNDLGVEGCELEIDSVFGAGNLTAYNPTTPGSYPAVNIINGTVNDVVFGGGKQAAVTSNPVVTIGDNNNAHHAAVSGKVFGGGDEAGITGSTHVVLNSGNVGLGIYGGCNTEGTVTDNSTVDLLGGQVGAINDSADIFGGGYGADTKVDGNVHITFGNAAGTATPVVYGEMYGGSALGSVNTNSSNVNASTKVNSTNTTTIDILSGTFNGSIYGGGLGQKNGVNGATEDIAALVHGAVQINVGASGSPYTGSADLHNATIYGCNNLNGTPENDVHIDVYRSYHPANTLATDTLSDAYAIYTVYGGGNRANYAPENGLATSSKKTYVHVYGCDNTVREVYGGGNAAAVVGDSVIIDGGRYDVIFGGGNGEITAANVGLGGVHLNARSGRVGYIYQQCNKRGNIAGDIKYYQGGGDCNNGKLTVDYHFCGGNEQHVYGDSIYTFGCEDAVRYRAIYGGCRLGSHFGNITLYIQGGTIGTVYGGSMGGANFAANIRRYPSVAEIDAGDADEYPTGMRAYMVAHPELVHTGGNITIHIQGGDIGSVFGGCNVNGNVEGRITVIIDSNQAGKCALDLDYVYGGGNLATYSPDTVNAVGAAYYDADHVSPYILLKNGHVNYDVFGGGKGNDGSVNYGSVTSNPKIVMNPDVANSKNFLIKGNLYGGGELGQVNGSTSIDIDAGTVKGTVYGGGKGHTSHESFGLVTKNTLVDISGGTVERSVYGGGSLGSVGTFTETWPSNGTTNGVFHKAGEPKTCATNTGLCKVLLSGTAQVGVSSKAHMPSTLLPGDDEYGYVFAASQGIADSVLYPKANLLGVACTTYLEISGSALVTASAYGGSENGEVLSSTYVKVMGGQIGVGGQLVEGVFTPDPVYTSEQWTAAIDAVKNGTIGTSYVNPFHECDHWPYGNAGNFYSYDIFADEEGYDSHGGSTTASDGHTFFGNVFGGGSGYYPFATGKWRRSAGRVLGHTKVEVTGGHILTSIYGGNETTDVLGDSCVVIFSGGTLGVPRTVSQMQDHPVTCYLFGAGKGDERVMFNRWTNVQNTRVTVSGGHIFGSVFGGGEDGHVMRNTKVDILGDAYIGTTGTSYVDGNVFGGGRGFSGNALTVGNVAGDITVNITGDTILGSIYGGGRLASVGYGLYPDTDPRYGVIRPDNEDDAGNTVAGFSRGHITVNISGNTVIGNDNLNINGDYDYNSEHSKGGNVYGGSMGRLTKLDRTMVLPLWHRLGCAKATTVNIRDNVHVKGNVYGGSELGRVTDSITVNISGNVTVGRNAAGSYGHGNVYGGGMGHTLTAAEVDQISNADTKDSIPTFAGLTGGTIKVNISGGAINNNVYGAGELASVGTIATVTKHTDKATTYFLSWPYKYTYNGNSGDARVKITGGTIGFINGSDTTGGNIYGSARGIVGDRYVTGRLATARVTHVDINLTNPGDKIIGDVYGSGENGHVYDSAVVTLRNGLVLGNVFGGGKGVDTYTDQLKRADESTYDTLVYDIIAGKVFGNTKVNILGGRVAKNVYGGGNLASVGIGNYKGYGEGTNVSSADSLLAENSGHCYVTILGGVIGPGGLAHGTVDSISDYFVTTGHVFGGGKGIVFPTAKKVGFDYDRDYYVGYVNKTTVVIGDPANPSSQYTNSDPHVTGNLFGGGENGHVRFDTYIQTNRGQIGLRPIGKLFHSDQYHWRYRGSIFGAGRGEDTNPDGSYCQSAGSVTRNTTIDIFGARIYRNVQGGGAMASVGPIKGRTGDSSTCVINIEFPSINDTIGGGSNNNKDFGGYIGGGSRGIPSPDGTRNDSLATCHNSQINVRQGYIQNTVYGGGENGQMLGNTQINVYGGYIRSAIYGGGKGSWKAPVSETGDATGDYTNDTLSGYIAGNTTVNLLGGQVPFTYGGCRRANVGGNATINIGEVKDDGSYSGEASFIVGKDKVYGGNQYAGSPRGNIYVNVYKTAHTAKDAASYTANDATYAINYVYGGSYNSPYLPNKSGHYAQVHVYGCDNTINEVYGGCASANVGAASPGIGANTKLIIDGGRFNNVYGGGDGTYDRFVGGSVPANIYGAAITEIHGGTFGSLYGGSNYNGNVDTIRISVESDGLCGDTIKGDEFFGGSNVTDLGPIELSATLGCGVKFNAAYGGSNMADITGNVTFNIQGGTLGKVFGGSKGRQAKATIVTPATDTAIAANIDGNVTLNATGGTLGYVYGGSNLNGNITGTITVNIDSIQSECPLTIENNVYGGSYVTMYNPTGIVDRDNTRSPVVNIKHGTIGRDTTTAEANEYKALATAARKEAWMINWKSTHGNVFGGGHGQGSRTISNPTVYIGNGNYTTSIDDPRTTAVEENNIIDNQPVVMGNVYGGGAQSRVLGNTRVDMLLGTVEGDIFGACKGIRPHERPDLDEIPTRGIVDGWTTVNMIGGTVHGNLYGGGEIGSVDHFTGENSSTWSRYSSQSAENQAKYGNTYVNVTGGTVGYPKAVFNSDDSLSFVYGGGKGQDSAAYKEYANVKNTYVSVSGGLVSGSVFGGAEDGHVLGNTNVIISNTVADSAYHAAHNDVAVGTVLTTPVIGSGGFTHEFDGCVLGGGLNINNLHRGDGRVQGNTYVTVTGGRIRRSVFGGGAKARVGVDVEGLLADRVLLYANDVYDSLKHGSTFVDVSGDTVQYASAAAFEASDYYATYQTTTRTYSDGKVTLYLTTIGGPDNATLVDNDYTIGDIFGGGKGDTKDTSDIFAGRVMNTHVKVHGSPRIMADIYAGGEMSCIGWYDTGAVAATPALRDAYYDNTGYTKVNIKDSPYVGSPYEFSSECIHGGRPWTLIDAHGRLYHTCSGNVYGGGQGYVELGATHRHNWVQMGRVRKTQVIINGGRFLGNVFGGGSRGFVKEDCSVTVTGGHFGCVIEDPLNNLGDKRYYYGSIFGGGYGNHKYFSHKNDSCFVKLNGDTVEAMPIEMAGRVYGNTYVNVSGGTIMHSIYGGGDMASTGWVERNDTTGNYYYDTPAKRHGGVCTVKITGTTIVGPLDYTGHNAYVYGAGKGIPSDPTDKFKHCANVNETHLTINLGPTGRIWGSSFGGGADAHVLGDVETQYHGGTMGTRGITSYDGNIFGAGRNYLNSNHTNGRVQGNIKILMDGGAIKGTIFGGGRLALSGVDSVGHFIDARHGNVNIWVSGNASIGTTHADSLLFADESCGDIFGSGKGDVKNYEDIWAGRVTNAKITVKDTVISENTYSPRIYGSIFGGGEMASLGWWNDTIKDGNDIDFSTRGDDAITDIGKMYTGTGVATITISGNVLVGTSLEYTVNPDENPGDWTIYSDDKDSLIHTCTGNVFGGGQGDIDPSTPRWVSMGRSASATVNISGGTFMGNIFGGGEQSVMTGNPTITISGGTFGIDGIDTITPFIDLKYNSGDIYGAGYGCDDLADNAATWEDEKGVTHPNVNDSTGLRSGLPDKPADLAGRVYGNTRVDILGGHIYGDIYGGGSFASVGYEKSGKTAAGVRVNGNTLVNIGAAGPTGSGPTGSGATIDGSVFGANNYSGSPFGNTEVNIYRTAHTTGDALVYDPEGANVTVVTGDSYPSGLKAVADAADELDDADMTALSGPQHGSLSQASRFALTAVYGGGNKAAHTPLTASGTTDNDDGTTLVHVWYCEENTICDLYGGGNAANNVNNHVIVDGGRIRTVFGGGNGAGTGNPGADVSGTAHTEIHGGIIDSVYGGSNARGYVPNINLVMDNDPASGDAACEELIANSFGGGNEAEGGGGTITLSCGAHYDNFYAGANNADIGSETEWNAGTKHNVVLNIEGGSYVNVFGGNNQGGTIWGNVIVNYRGGSIQNLYGGNNAGGHVKGFIEVNVDVDPDYSCADGLRLDNVYGGGNNAAYSPYDPFAASPRVNIKNNRWHSGSGTTAADSSFVNIRDVFGGGQGATAEVTGFPRVLVGGFGDTTVNTKTYSRAARIFHNVYGGGNAAPLNGNPAVIVRNAVIGPGNASDSTDDEVGGAGTVFGGGYGATSKVTGNTYVAIHGLSDIKNNVYGGGNAGVVTGNTHVEMGYLLPVLPPEIVAYKDTEDGNKIKATFRINGMDNAGTGCNYYYTTDGSRPDTLGGGTTVTGNTPFEITFGNPVRCIATKSGYMPSVMMNITAPAPDIVYDSESGKVSFGATVGTRIYYTTDGSTPTTSSTLYGTVGEDDGTPFSAAPGTTVKAIAQMRGCADSPVVSFTVPTP